LGWVLQTFNCVSEHNLLLIFRKYSIIIIIWGDIANSLSYKYLLI
jgi:hypothetical protein